MNIFRRRSSSGYSCPANEPVYRQVERIPTQWRQSTRLFVKQHSSKEKSTMNLITEIYDLIYKLESRIYCFMKELQRTKVNYEKYNVLLNLYNNIQPYIIMIMDTCNHLQETKEISDEVLFDVYLNILRALQGIGENLLEYVSQNLDTLNDKYQYPQTQNVPKCYNKLYPQVLEKMKQGAPSAVINEVKIPLIQKCVMKQHIQQQCASLYDPAAAGGGRDLFIAQAFMRIDLLISTIRKERQKLRQTINPQVLRKVQSAQQEINQTVFKQLKRLVEDPQRKASSQRKTYTLKDRTCSK